MANLNLLNGLANIILAGVAIYISIKGDQKMKALANLEFDEKLAVMAAHRESIKTNKTLGFIELIKNDLSAASNLRKYADRKKKEELIKHYVIPILDTILNEENISEECAEVVAKIIDIALEFNIASEELKGASEKLKDRRKKCEGRII